MAKKQKTTILIEPSLQRALKRAAKERRRDEEWPFTQQAIVEVAIKAWLQENGYLATEEERPR